MLISGDTRVTETCNHVLPSIQPRLVAGGKQVANWSLKAIHELAFLVDRLTVIHIIDFSHSLCNIVCRSTPFALGALNMLSKVVGGFYVLLAMIWRDVR